jgi:Response regulator containing a CheY-like receiver domain and a GGDEF domain
MDALQRLKAGDIGRLLHDKDVLLIGVDEVDEMLLRYMIQEHGAQLVVENRTEEALDLISQRKYDLLIINTRLERLNTLELIYQKRQKKEIRVPVIGITSRNLMGRGLSSGFDYIIRRPIEKKKFHQALVSVMR